MCDEEEEEDEMVEDVCEEEKKGELTTASCVSLPATRAKSDG